MFRKGQKSLEMIIGLVILLVVAGVVISTFLNQFQDNPGSQYEDTLQKEDIKRTCQSKCSAYKTASGIRAQTAAIDYCTSTFNYDADGDGSLTETAGRLYNSYCEDGVKCFNVQTCEIGRDTLNAERCKEIMQNYYTSEEVGMSTSEANNQIENWYTPNGEGDKTIGTCNLEDAKQVTWYSENFKDIGSGSSSGGGGSGGGPNSNWCEDNSGNPDATTITKPDGTACLGTSALQAVNNLYSGSGERTEASNLGTSPCSGTKVLTCDMNGAAGVDQSNVNWP